MPTTTTLRVRHREYLKRYRVDSPLLRKAELRAGKPSIASGEDLESGARVVIRHWRRDPNVDDAELRQIWHEELRQLQRLFGFPGARKHIVRLIESGEDSDGFYLTLSPGQRLPLAHLLATLPLTHWLRASRSPANRARVWNSLRGIVIGLDLLHMQGFLHRNLDAWSIFSAGDEDDFQLSGFEWSVRLSSLATDAEGSRNRKASPGYSFTDDWRALGALAASLLGFKPSVERRTADASDDAPREGNLTFVERDLLQCLAGVDPLFRYDAENILERINAISASLQASVAKSDSRLVLVASVGRRAELGSLIRKISSQSIDVDDAEGQLAFIRLDLEQDPPVLAWLDEGGGGPRMVLVGRTLTYKLKPFRAGSSGAGTWDAAFCESALEARPHPKAIAAEAVLATRSIDVLSFGEAQRTYATRQGKTQRWDMQIPTAEDDLDPISLRNYRGLLLLQLLEALLVASNSWPVEVVRTEQRDDRTLITVIPKVDQEREELSKALGLRAPNIRLKETLLGDEVEGEGAWTIGDVGALGERDDESGGWQFVESLKSEEDGDTYRFEGVRPPPAGKRLFLRNTGFIGTDMLLKRRLRSLRTLREHVELLEMLADPRSSLARTHETVSAAGLSDLDESKTQALQDMWSVLPLFLVQGPPGVGKTKLVTELVSKRLHDDPTARLLLTAQSHHAVDHLLDEVRRQLKNVSGLDALMVRSRPKDYDEPPEESDLPVAARKILSAVASSEATKAAPERLAKRVKDLADAYGGPDDDAQLKHLGRTVEALLLRSANLVFASTNAGDLERLIEEHSQFDWTIIEEAGKALGVELVAPLLLSHRRLMIGDHQQLPPYGERTLKKLLAEPARIMKALDVGRALVGRVFRDAELEEVVDEGREEDALTAVCGEAARALALFETLVVAELDSDSSGRNRTRIAAKLKHQHRMHPSIAELVSDVFYKGDLITDEECRKRFEKTRCPVAVKNNMPDSPIVFLSTPFSQKVVGQKPERTPRFHNPDEVAVVIDALASLQVHHTATRNPTLAVLSPYRQQVKRLEQSIRATLSTRLSNLKHFDWERERDTPVATVDAFQGSEADVVVISLVRNNHHDGPAGLGFLADARRMNVLLSRAKWKLIIVGSWDFLETRFPDPKQVDPEHRFLPLALSTIKRLSKVRLSPAVTAASVLNASEIARGSK